MTCCDCLPPRAPRFDAALGLRAPGQIRSTSSLLREFIRQTKMGHGRPAFEASGVGWLGRLAGIGGALRLHCLGVFRIGLYSRQSSAISAVSQATLSAVPTLIVVILMGACPQNVSKTRLRMNQRAEEWVALASVWSPFVVLSVSFGFVFLWFPRQWFPWFVLARNL